MWEESENLLEGTSRGTDARLQMSGHAKLKANACFRTVSCCLWRDSVSIHHLLRYGCAGWRDVPGEGGWISRVLVTWFWCFHTEQLGEKEERDPGRSVCMDFAQISVFRVAVLFILDFNFPGKKTIWF